MASLTYKFPTDAAVKAFVQDAEVFLGPRGSISHPDSRHVQVSHPGINVVDHTGMWDQVAGKHGGSRTTCDDGHQQTVDAGAIRASFEAALAFVDSLPGNRIDVADYVEAWRRAGPGMSIAAAEDTFRQASVAAPDDHRIALRQSLRDVFRKVIADPEIAIRIANMR
jgi:hypothetical protein